MAWSIPVADDSTEGSTTSCDADLHCMTSLWTALNPPPTSSAGSTGLTKYTDVQFNHVYNDSQNPET
jgi:hypothetical protein